MSAGFSASGIFTYTAFKLAAHPEEIGTVWHRPCLGHVIASQKWHRCDKNQLHIGAEFRTFRFLLLGRFASWERTDDTSEGLQMLRLEGQFWRVWTVRTPFFVHGGCKKSLTLVAINFT